MRLPRGGNRGDVPPLPGAVGAAVLPVALPSALDEAEVKRRSRQGHATARLGSAGQQAKGQSGFRGWPRFRAASKPSRWNCGQR
jgi:hypothetical protein